MRTVNAPDGSVHTVRIEWIGNRLRRAPADLRRRVRIPRRASSRSDARRASRERRRGDAVLDVAAEGCMSFDEVAVAVAVVVALVLIVVLVLPALYGLLEVLAVLVIAALLWAFRVLFRRPWSIVHRGPGDVESARCEVVGWRRAHATLVAAADEIERTGSARISFGAQAPFS